MEFISGELIAYDLASKLCELNDWALDSDNHAIAEIQYRESIERGLSEGQITPYYSGPQKTDSSIRWCLS